MTKLHIPGFFELLMSVVEHAMPYCVTDECESDDDEIDKRLLQQIALAWEVP